MKNTYTNFGKVGLSQIQILPVFYCVVYERNRFHEQN